MATRVEDFATRGYYIARGLFDPSLAEAALQDDVSAHLNSVIHAFNRHRGQPVDSAAVDALCRVDVARRLAAAESTPGLEHVSVTGHKTAWCSPGFQRIVAAEPVIETVRQLLTALGPGTAPQRSTVAAHPVFNLRCKPPTTSTAPYDEGAVPWHQDAAYIATPAHVQAHFAAPQQPTGVCPVAEAGGCELCQTPQITMWTPLVALEALGRAELEAAAADHATAHPDDVAHPGRLAGPLSIVPGPWMASRGGGGSNAPLLGTLLPHEGCEAGTWYLYIPDHALTAAASSSASTSEVADPTAISAIINEIATLGPGDAVFFHSFTPHRALPNRLVRTQAARWTCDIRFQWAGDFSGCDCESLPLEGRPDEIDWQRLPCCRPVDMAAAEDEPSFLESVIGGPWMDAWPMPRSSRHVEAYRCGRVAFPEPRYATAASPHSAGVESA